MRRIVMIPVLALLAAGCAAPGVSAEKVGPSLRDQRDRAVRAGLRWLEGYLSDEKNADALGVDTVAIFADYAATAVDESSRKFALEAAMRHARLLEKSYIALGSIEADELADMIFADELVDIIFLISQMRELGLSATALQNTVARKIRALPDPDNAYGLDSLAPHDLDLLKEYQAFALLLGVYAVERAAATGDDFGIRFGLEQLLPVILRRRLITRAEDPDPSGGLFRAHVYRATHIAYVLTDYGRLRQREADAPGVFEYLRRVFPDVLAAKDVELVAEIVDVFLSLGHDETSNSQVRAGTVFLLGAQNEDGSWGPAGASADAYVGAHHTWCAIMALGERRFLSDTPYERRLRRILRR